MLIIVPGFMESTVDRMPLWLEKRYSGSFGFFLMKLNKFLSYKPAIPLLDFYSREIKIYVHKKTSTGMCIAALFIMAKNLETGQGSINRRTDT